MTVAANCVSLVATLLAVWTSSPATATNETVAQALQVSSQHPEHFLDDAELGKIYSVECLRRRQVDPTVICTGQRSAANAEPAHIREHRQRQERQGRQRSTRLLPGQEEGEPLGIATYPSWQEKRCRSGGELLCDPEGILGMGKDRQDILLALHEFQEQVYVQCRKKGALYDERYPGEVLTEEQRFSFGVAIASHFPEMTDAQTLQSFGLVVMSRWGLLPIYNGASSSSSQSLKNKPLHDQGCPNSALLILLPDTGEAFLSSASCELLCNDRGGPEITVATETALQREGPVAAIKAGLEQVRRVLKITRPLSLQPNSESLAKQQAHRFLMWNEKVWASDLVYVSTTRCIYGAILVLTGIGMAAFASYNFHPPKENRHDWCPSTERYNW